MFVTRQLKNKPKGPAFPANFPRASSRFISQALIQFQEPPRQFIWHHHRPWVWFCRFCRFYRESLFCPARFNYSRPSRPSSSDRGLSPCRPTNLGPHWRHVSSDLHYDLGHGAVFHVETPAPERIFICVSVQAQGPAERAMPRSTEHLLVAQAVPRSTEHHRACPWVRELSKSPSIISIPIWLGNWIALRKKMNIPIFDSNISISYFGLF